MKPVVIFPVKLSHVTWLLFSDNFCYCGDDIAEESTKRSDAMCNLPCGEGNNNTCGGDWLMSVYRFSVPTTTTTTTTKATVTDTGMLIVYVFNKKLVNSVTTLLPFKFDYYNIS